MGDGYLEEKMDPKKILQSIQLPPLSRSLQKIIELDKQNPLSLPKEIKNILEKDSLLSTYILKVANSPFYGFSMEVRTISHAIGLLGVGRILSIAFTFSMIDFFKKVEFQPEFEKIYNLILKKSFLLSAVSAILAKKSEYTNSNELYVSGLLADIGQMILFLYSPKNYCKIYSTIDKNLISEERKKFKTDHIEVGIAFCSQWHFPAFIKTAIKNHFELSSDNEHSKICFISNKMAELLLTEKEKDKKSTFMEIESHMKKLLRLWLPQVEEIIKTLPLMMEVYINDFPEIQKELKEIVETGSSFIMRSVKKEVDLAILTMELTDSQNKLAKEKIFLSHMLDLSYFFSSLTSPQKIISSLFKYFENVVVEFTIEFLYKIPEGDEFLFMTGKEKGEGRPISIHDFDSLVKARISNEVIRLEADEMKQLNKDPGTCCLAFPISYHHNFFGFLLLNVNKEKYLIFDLETFYVQILANMIAFSFQNYFTLQSMKKEINKKELVFKELSKFEEKWVHSKEIRLQLQKSEITGELLPVIFHKLKNKLTPILGYSQVLLTKVKDTDIHQRIKKIEKNANELTEQLNLLRDYFKSDLQLKDRENLNNIVNHLKPYFSEIEAKKKIKIDLDLDYSIPEDTLISGQIECLITNIVENAVHAIEEKGDCEGIITIKTKSELSQGSYTLTIRDNGIGIKTKDIHLIWAPFYSGFRNTPGLGLAVCERIISNHEGLHSVESREGEYTEFKITFTLKPQKQEKIEEPIRGLFKPTHGKILIVHDEDYLTDLMREILMNEGDFNITTTTKGVEAVKLIDSSFNLIISDIRMPEINGMDIYDYLKSKKIEAKMIMLTTDPLSSKEAEFLKMNKIDYLKKPFQLMEFKKTVLEKLSDR
jgi:HD-like signal output (HDOD) protein/signal transduction histidine kinase/CheY-like chemotaxis protein